MSDAQASLFDRPAQPPKPRFTKVYEKGLDRIEQLIAQKGGPTAGKFWLFLVRNCGHDNALAATIDVIAEELGCSEKSVRNAAKYLEENGAIVVAKMGTANVYILNDGEVWKTYEEHHHYCSFRAKAIVSNKANPNLKRRLTHVLGREAEADD